SVLAVVRRARRRSHVRRSWSGQRLVTTCYGPQTAMIAESFTPRLRYSCTSLGYQLASIIAGGPSPFIAPALFATFAPSFPIALYILGRGMRHRGHYTNKDISDE